MSFFNRFKKDNSKNSNENNTKTNSNPSAETKPKKILRYNEETFSNPKEYSFLYIFWNKYGEREVAMTTINDFGRGGDGFIFKEILNNLFISTVTTIENNESSCVRILRYDFSNESEAKFFMYAVRDVFKELDTVLERKIKAWNSEDFAHINLVKMNLVAFISEESLKMEIKKNY